MRSIRLTIFDAAQRAEWRAALASFAPDDDVYFSPEYHAASAGPGGGEPRCALLEDGASALLLPYLRCPIPGGGGLCDVQSAYGYGGPLVRGAQPGFLGNAWAALCDAWRRESVVAAFLRCHPLGGNQDWLSETWRVSFDRQTIAVDLRGGIDAAFSESTAAKHRRDISRATRAGFESVELADARTGLDEFMAHYERAMERLGAGDFYFFPKSYYDSLLGELGERASLFQVRQRNTGELASTGIALWGQRWGHYHLGASRVASGGPNFTHMLMQAMAESAVRRGCEMLHLGGGRTPAPDDALLHFKRRVSRHERSFYTAGKVIDEIAYAGLVRDWTSRHGRVAPNWFLGYRQPSPPAPVSAALTR